MSFHPLVIGGAILVALYFLFKRAGGKMGNAESTPAAAAPAPAPAPRPKPELKDFTTESLAKFTGENGQPIYVAADGIVFDMSSHESGPAFYGPGGGYHVFAGRDSSIGLATMEVDHAKWEKKPVSELSFAQQDVLRDWVSRFSLKYAVVGFLNDGSNPKTVATHKQ